ncbi:MAG: hypothetical protein H6741_08410 [Alphaproteobacteria bacterium]|nr:hypothetical protein [Alphaproteobacteria bacterium]MCB9792739.1 hypothetical protein [Alphaproteobacteria bacterium]
MSVSETFLLDCPTCGTANLFRRYVSVNARRSAALREAILDRSFLSVDCAGCGHSFRAPPDFTYMDQDLDLWVNARPLEERGAWEQGELDTQLVHLQLFVADAPPVVAALGARLRARLTYGWAGLREKILCAQAGVDDVALELAKMSALIGARDALYVDGAQLRAVEIDAAVVRCAWLVDRSQSPLALLDIPRDFIEEIAQARAPWAALEAEISSGFYVDVSRALQLEAA